MTDEERQKITELRINGFGYKAIATTMGMNRNNVRSFCQRHGIGGSSVVAALNLEEQKNSALICRHCNKKLTQSSIGRKRKFCSEVCRRNWWQLHPGNRKPKELACKKIKCKYCGVEFQSYGNTNRRFCSHVHYIKSRFWTEQDNNK